MEENLTEKDKAVLFLIRDNGPMTPTNIGMYLGQKYTQASSYVSPNLRKLMRLGKIKRDNKAQYRYIDQFPA